MARPIESSLLLRRVRRAMAGDGDWQSRLNRAVELLATGMNVAVCSVYLMRRESGHAVLELCATEGLDAKAVHKTRLRLGEGLVGDIALHARALNLADAARHPSFAARPETGEEHFPAFAGVPILRGGEVRGVLAVQNSIAAAFPEEAVAELQSVAMVLAELLADVRLTRQHRLAQEVLRQFEGLGLVDGLALGQVVLHVPHVEIGHMIADNAADEERRLDAGLYALRRSVDALLQTEGRARWGEHLDVLETYQMFANDEGWRMRLNAAVRTGLTAEAAVERVLNAMRARLMGQHDAYLRERLHDLEDLSHRLLRQLMQDETAQRAALPKDAVLLAHMLGPADLLDYHQQGLRALVLEEGSPQAHVTIVARALGLPMVGRVRNLLASARMGQAVLVDGGLGQVHLTPSAAVLRGFRARAQKSQREQQSFARLRHLPALTRDGVQMALSINAGLLVDVQHLQESGAAGIGLFRTELQFLISARMPRLAEQIAFYASVLEAAKDRPLVFRTLDIGGDKIAPYMRLRHEQNPAMGWRALRLALDRPGFLRYQVRALLRAAARRPLQLMLPMVSAAAEYGQAKALIMREYAHMKRLRHPLPRALKIGAMLEVPVLVWELDALLPQVDFLAIGSNDLLQFAFASDRSNPLVSERYDMISPAALAMLSAVVAACARHKTPLSLCGEAAGQPLEALVLMALGLRSLSMPRASLGPVKRMVRSVDLARFRTALQEELAARAPASNLRERLRAVAQKQGIKL